MDSLTLTVTHHDYGSVELRGLVHTAGFAGTGAAWFEIDELEAFCSSLAAYPIDSERPPALAGGYWERGGAKLKETNLSIHIIPYDRLGRLQVSVQLAEPAAITKPGDRARSVRTWFVVGYNDLDIFRSAFAKALHAKAQDAVLASTLD